MRFTVIWNQATVSKLAELWVQGENREDISRSTDLVDRTIRDDPSIQGEDYYGDRLLEAGALFVAYKISEDDRIVTVFDVWRKGPSPTPSA